MLVEDTSGGTAGPADLAAWESMFPSRENGYLMLDPTRELSGSLKPTGFPSFHMVDEQFVWKWVNDDAGEMFYYLLEY